MSTFFILLPKCLLQDASRQISCWTAHRDPVKIYRLLLVVPEVYFKETPMAPTPNTRPGLRRTQREIVEGIQGQILRVCRLFLLEARQILLGRTIS
jgi:hypothetical protein